MRIVHVNAAGSAALRRAGRGGIRADGEQQYRGEGGAERACGGENPGHGPSHFLPFAIPELKMIRGP
jgi:hypothetical protein